jgi:hypothetical protein
MPRVKSQAQMACMYLKTWPVVRRASGRASGDLF